MSLKRQLFWNMSPLLVISVVNIFSVPLFFRYLGADMYALWFYVITFTGMFGFADLGLGVAVGRYMGVALGKGDHAALREYWGTGNMIALPLLAASGLAFAVLGITVGAQWFNVAPENEPLLRLCFLVGGVTLFLGYYTQYWNILLQVYLDFKAVGFIRTTFTLLQVIPGIVIAWRTRSPLWIFLWGALISVLQLVVFAWYSRVHYRLGFELNSARRARAREMAGFTVKTFGNLVTGALLSTIDRVILGRFATAAAFSHYTIASNVGMRVQGLGVSVMPPVFHNTSRAAGRGQPASSTAIFDEMFDFTFGWYVLASVWVAVWHPIALRLWLGADLGAAVSPLFTPLIVAFCLSGLASTSGSQLSALNRAGTSLAFNIAAGLTAAAGAYIGWRVNGVLGVAYGFLASRLVYVAQDIFTARLVGAKGWLNPRLWLGVFLQVVLGGMLALVYLFVSKDSPWLLVPAGVHAAAVAAWLLRHQLRKVLGGFFTRRQSHLAEGPRTS